MIRTSNLFVSCSLLRSVRMSTAALSTHVYCFINPPRMAGWSPKSFSRRRSKHSGNTRYSSAFNLFRIKSVEDKDADKYKGLEPKNVLNEQIVDEGPRDAKSETVEIGDSFLLKLAVALAVAAALTVMSIGKKEGSLKSVIGVQRLSEASSSSSHVASPVGFTFNALGYRFILPQYTPGWVYFWLLMAAGCGLFISEEALNIWVGISLARMLSVDWTWHSYVKSLSGNATYIISTLLWVYWGVCISDMIPFYLGRWLRKSGASDDVYSKLGIGKEKALGITRIVQKYGNFIGCVERFSIGVRNPTAFLAGAMGISPECFFTGVCCGGLITLPVQLGIGFLLRERPMFSLATVAAAVGVWTIFPYLVAASTALFLFIRRL